MGLSTDDPEGQAFVMQQIMQKQAFVMQRVGQHGNLKQFDHNLMKHANFCG